MSQLSLVYIAVELVVPVGVPDRLFKRHGRWRSENAKDGYVGDSIEKRLSVTKQLGL